METIRAEQPGDADAIHALHRSAFPGPGEARLVDDLRADGALTVSLVAIADDALVGHVAFSPVRLDGAVGGVGLAPVAVLASQRRRGIADRLIREGLTRCRLAGARWVVVLGAPAYFARFGFVAAPPRGLVDDYGGGDAFQVLELAVGGLAEVAGVVHYAAAFERLDDPQPDAR